MTNEEIERSTAEAIEELDAAWQEFEDNLAAYLATMTDPRGCDRLLIELTGHTPDGDGRCLPYARFTGDDGELLHSELSGNANLLPQHQLDDDGCAFLIDRGWEGNLVDGDPEERNWTALVAVQHVGMIADEVAAVLRHHFKIAHPQLLTYAAFGPAAKGADAMGLVATDDIPVDDPAPAQATSMPLVQVPADRDDLLAFVGAVLRQKYEEEPTLDDDGDFVLYHLGQPVWVRVRPDQPAVEIMARVAHGVHSRRATSVELGLLNRDHAWARWTLRERTIWQTLLLPGAPFVPMHLVGMLDVFLAAMTETRDDLALRTGARVA